MAASTVHSLEDAQAALARLRSDAVIPAQELIDIKDGAVVATARALAICQAAQQSIGNRKSPRRSVPNILAWIIGVGGYACGLGDYFFFGLSPWGWSGLLSGTGGLFVAAYLWQLDDWDTQDDELKQEEAQGWEPVLRAIRDELNRRADRDKVLPAIAHEQGAPGPDFAKQSTPPPIRNKNES